MNESSKLSHLSSDLCSGWRSTNALNLIPFTYLQSSHNQPTWLPTQFGLGSVYMYRSRSLFVVTLARPSLSSLQITNHFLDMPRLTCGISSLLHSVNLILFILLLWFTWSCAHHLITVPHLRFTILSLPQHLLQTINTSVSQTHSFIVFLVPFGLPSQIFEPETD